MRVLLGVAVAILLIVLTIWWSRPSPPPIASTPSPTVPPAATATLAPITEAAPAPTQRPAFSEPMMPNLKGASVAIAASFVSALSQKRIVLAPDVSGRIDFAPGVVRNKDELLNAFLTTLRSAGYQVTPQGEGFLVSNPAPAPAGQEPATSVPPPA